MKSWTAPQASPASGLWSSSSTLSVEIGKIKYEQVDSPVKFYKKIYHHFLGNLYKAGDVVAYKEFSKDWRWKAFPHTVELDGRLLKRSKDIILKAIHDLLTKLETKDVDANSASAQLTSLHLTWRGEIFFPRKVWKWNCKSKTLDRTNWWKSLQIVPSRKVFTENLYKPQGPRLF